MDDVHATSAEYKFIFTFYKIHPFVLTPLTELVERVDLYTEPCLSLRT